MAERVAATVKAPETKQKCSNSCKQKPSFNSSGSSADRILQLQRTAGNQAVQKIIKSRALQAKLKISQPNDIYEQEADRVAEQIMRMPEPSVSSIEFSKIPIFPEQVQRKCLNYCNQKPGFNPSGSSDDRILQPQRNTANQAVQRLLKSRALQAKLKTSQPKDVYEQEADRVAEQVMRMPDPAIQKKQKCPLRNDASCKEDEIDEIAVMKKEAGAQIRPSSFQDNILFRQQEPTKLEPSNTPKSYDEKTAPVFALPLIHRLVYYKDTDSYNDLVTGTRYSRKELENYAESTRNQINRYKTVISILHRKLKELQDNPASGKPNKPANEYISEAFYEEAQQSFFITSDTIGGYTEADNPYVKDFCSIVMQETEDNPFFVFPFWQHERSHQKTCLSNKENYRKQGLSELEAKVKVANEFNEPIFLIKDEINSYEVTVRELEKELSAFFSGSIDTASKGPMSLPETYSIHRKAALEQSEYVSYPRTSALPDIHNVLQSPGQPLDTQTRVFFESRFGYDFSNVRIHTDGKAAESARAVNALAYVVGNNIVFGSNQKNLGTMDRQRLLAHELTHIVQQSLDNNARPRIMREQITTVHTNYNQWNLQQPRSLTQTLDPTLISKDDLTVEIDLINQWLRNNTAPGTERDRLLRVLSTLEQSRHETKKSVMIEKELSEDFNLIVKRLNKFIYSPSDEALVFTILKKWATFPNPPSNNLRQGSYYLEFLFRKLQDKHKDIGVLTEQISNYYTQLFKRSGHLDELRILRDTYSPLYKGYEGVKEINFGGVLWESVKKGEVRDQIYAYGKGLKTGVAAGANAMAHPIEAIKGIYFAVRHFDQTKASIKRIYTQYKDTASKNPVKFAEMTGELVGQVEVALAGPKVIVKGGGLLVKVAAHASAIKRWIRILLTGATLGVGEVVPKMSGASVGTVLAENVTAISSSVASTATISEQVATRAVLLQRVEQAVQAAQHIVQAANEVTQVTATATTAAGSAISAVETAGTFSQEVAGVLGVINVPGSVVTAVAQVSGQVTQTQAPFLMPSGFLLGQVSVPQVPTPQVLGQQIENPIRQLVAQRYGFRLSSKAPSATGPDIEVPAAARPVAGFDIADVKPANARGLRKFWDQLDNWRDFGWAGGPKSFNGKAALFIYDNQGNVYLYGIFDT